MDVVDRAGTRRGRCRSGRALRRASSTSRRGRGCRGRGAGRPGRAARAAAPSARSRPRTRARNGRTRTARPSWPRQREVGEPQDQERHRAPGSIAPASPASISRLRLAPEEATLESADSKTTDRVAHRDAGDQEEQREAAASTTAGAASGPASSISAPERRLVHRRQQQAERDDPEERLLERSAAPSARTRFSRRTPAPPRGARGTPGESSIHSTNDVGHDAERDLEQRGVEVPAPEEQRHLPDDPRPADVEDDRDAGERVAERARQDRGPDERVILPLVEDVDEERRRRSRRTRARCR